MSDYYIIKLISKVFHKTKLEIKLMLSHMNLSGKVNCGAFPREVAETKVIEVIEYVKRNNLSLRCIMCRDFKDVIKKP